MGESALPMILAVAGSEEHLGWLQTALRGFRARIREARSGQEALEFVSEADPAFVVMWDELLDMSGTEVAALLRGDKTKAHIPVLLVASDERWEEVSSLAFEVGILDRVRWPIRQSVLVGKARIFIDMFEAKARARAEQAQLERSNRDLRDFAHAAAHDLRAPIRAVSAHAKLLARPDLEGLERERQLGSVLETVARMEALIEDMLGYASVDGTRIDQAVPLEICLQEVLLDFEPRLEASRASIHWDPLPEITGSAALLRGLLQNILGNAIDHAKPDTPPKVEITTEVKGRMVEIHFADNGVGFDMKWADDVFKPFRRLSPRTSGSGSGVGLATARRIVERHGGAIRASSAVGEGSVFTLRFPVTSAQIAELRRRTDAARQFEVVLVDDDPEDRVCSSEALSGFRVTTYETAERAIEGMSGSPDIIFADYRMPGEDGLWLLRQVADRHPSARRILLTGSVDEACRRALAEGLMERLLAKPLEPAMVREILGAEPSAHP